jgi:hypothetical protein
MFFARLVVSSMRATGSIGRRSIPLASRGGASRSLGTRTTNIAAEMTSRRPPLTLTQMAGATLVCAATYAERKAVQGELLAKHQLMAEPNFIQMVVDKVATRVMHQAKHQDATRLNDMVNAFFEAWDDIYATEYARVYGDLVPRGYHIFPLRHLRAYCRLSQRLGFLDDVEVHAASKRKGEAERDGFLRLLSILHTHYPDENRAWVALDVDEVCDPKLNESGERLFKLNESGEMMLKVRVLETFTLHPDLQELGTQLFPV